MKVLIIKTSSMGDVIHTLPALTDAQKAIVDIQFDWVVEESFAQIPSWHIAVRRVIPLAWRRWRKKLFSQQHGREWLQFLRQLRLEHYDRVLDAQGLIKSALITRLSHGPSAGFDWQSAREKWASLFYTQSYTVDVHRHAIQRTRELFAKTLNYQFQESVPDYGLDRTRLTYQGLKTPYVVFMHGTTWESKLWPLEYWQLLAEKMLSHGFTVYLPWGNSDEKNRAEQISRNKKNIIILPKLSINEFAGVLVGATAAVAVDTGFGHLAAALSVPCVSLYGPTDPLKVGTLGDKQHHLVAQFPCAPCRRRQCNYQKPSQVKPACFEQLSPDAVWQSLIPYLQIS